MVVCGELYGKARVMLMMKVMVKCSDVEHFNADVDDSLVLLLCS